MATTATQPAERRASHAANDAAVYDTGATPIRRARVTMRLPSGDVPLFHARRA